MILPMTKVQVIGDKRHLYPTISLLHDLGVIHLEDAHGDAISASLSNEDRDLTSRMALDSVGEEKKRTGDEQLLRLNAVLGGLPRPDDENVDTQTGQLYSGFSKYDFPTVVESSTEFLQEIETKVRTLANERSNLTKELASAEKYEAILEQFHPLLAESAPVEGYETIALLIDRRHEELVELLEAEIAEITGNRSYVTSADIGEDSTAAIIMFASDAAEAVRRLLWEEKVNEVRLPESIADTPFEQALAELHLRKQKIPYELEEVETHLKKLGAAWWPRIRAIRDVLLDHSEELKRINQFGETDYTFVVRGWIPSKEMDELEQLLLSRFGGEVMIENLEIGELDIDAVPVALSNGIFFKPYEYLLTFFQLPRYGSIDPSVMLGVFYLLFFGLIVGDAGYGLIIVGISLWLRSKYKDVEAAVLASAIFIWAGTSAIIFGFIYGEFFGDLLLRFHLIPHVTLFGVVLPVERTELIMPFLVLTAAIGAIHLFFGLSMGVVMGLRFKAYKHMAERVGMLLILIAGTLFVFTMALGLPSILMTVGWVLLIAGLAALAYSGGPVMLIMHFIDLIRNVASYTRLMALGLAGAFLANVANELAGMTSIVIFGGLIALSLHTLNIIIAVFSPTLHSLRLNFLEFFSTFYESGGREYKPFQRTEKVEST